MNQYQYYKASKKQSNKKYSQEIKEVEENFKNWLIMSNISLQDFLKYHLVSEFRIIHTQESFSDYASITMGRVENGKLLEIGQPIVYLQKDENSKVDVSLLLLYMASKLDEKNASSPSFLKRDKYFYKATKEFLNNEKIFQE